MSEVIAKRAIFYIGGYDPKSPDSFFTRLIKEAGRYEQLVGAQLSAVGVQQMQEDITLTRFTTSGELKGDSWKTETDFHFLSLDDIVLKDFKRPFFNRFSRSFLTTWDFLLSGTAFKFLYHAWRFFLYFAYPPMAVVFTAFLAWFIASWTWELDTPFSPILAIAAFIVVFSGLVVWFWKRWFVLHLMDLWSFSRDYLLRRRNDIELKLDRLSETAAETIAAGNYDEVLFIGHSTGAALILDVAARTQTIDNDFADKASNVSILTIGSTALKIGLHPRAGWYRERLQNLFDGSTINWFEYQCHSDVINFYKTNPAALMGLKMDRKEGAPQRPVTRSIRIKKMVSKKVYQRMRRNFFRVHYQFVFGNTLPYHYDFIGVCFGPAPLSKRAIQEFVEGE